MVSDRVPAQTSVPDWLMTYCRQLADVHHQRRLNKMYESMLDGFLRMKPWSANPPLMWRSAKTHGSSGMRMRPGMDPGWVPMNMLLSVDLSERIRNEVESINMSHPEGVGAPPRELSVRMFLFTAVYWWCTFVHPYRGAGMIAS